MSELLDRALEVIRAEREHARAKGIELIGVVGSVARGEERPDSDVDVAYDWLRPEASLLDLGGILMALQERIGREVGMVNPHRLKPERREYMLSHLVPA